MIITDLQAFGLEWAQRASGLPMKENPINICPIYELDTKDAQRAMRLADTPIGTGHDNFLVGITVHMTISATVKWWQQFQRYHFADIVSSQSTMHKLPDMLKNKTAVFHADVDERIISIITRMALEGASLEQLAYNCPMGLEMTAAVTTNYRQLKTIYQQRKTHRLQEWQEFCRIIAVGLPCSYLFTKVNEP